MSDAGTEPEATAVESVTVGEVSTEEAGTKVAEPEAGAKQDQTPEIAVDAEHTCSECGMSFQRRYSLIMHTLKHEKARGYKCSVSTGVGQLVTFSSCCFFCSEVLTIGFLFSSFSYVVRSSSMPPLSVPTWPDTSSRAASEHLSPSPQ